MALDHAIEATAATTQESVDVRIPAIVKRNTWLLALSQAFSGAGNGMVYSLGPLMGDAEVGKVLIEKSKAAEAAMAGELG